MGAGGDSQCKWYPTLTSDTCLHISYVQDIGRQLHEAAVSTHVYWAILMMPAPGHPAAFKRVGLGLLYPSARERGQEVTRSFAII